MTVDGQRAPDGFAEFVAVRSAALLRSAWLLTGDAGKAEDLLQTVLAKAWRRWPNIADGGAPEAYVRRALFTTYVSWLRRRWRAERPAAVPPAARLLDRRGQGAGVSRDPGAAHRPGPAAAQPGGGRIMNEPELTGIGRLLADAVPPLPEPADRVGQVRARVRRSRLRAGAAVTGAVAVLVVAALAVPSLGLGGTARVAPAVLLPLTGDSCPDRTYPVPAAGAPRQPVAAGAVEAMLCVVGFDTGELHDHQVLRTGADQLAIAINALPTWDEASLQCIERDTVSQLLLLLKYRDGSTTTVIIDGWCGISFVPDGPVWSDNVLAEFGRLYQEQVAATTPDPDTIATPECPATIGPDRLDLGSETSGPGPETIERPIRWPHWTQLRPGQPSLPYPLVAAAWCRYLLDGDRAELAVARPERGDLADLRDVLNTTFQLTETGEEPPSECGRDPELRAAVPDVLLVADAAGGIAEYWVYGNPDPTPGGGPACWDTFRDPIPVAATPALVDYLLDTLGP